MSCSKTSFYEGYVKAPRLGTSTYERQELGLTETPRLEFEAVRSELADGFRQSKIAVGDAAGVVGRECDADAVVDVVKVWMVIVLLGD